MNLLTTFLFVGNPLLIAFMVSVLIGATTKYKNEKVTMKYVLSGVAFLLYFLIYAYGVFVFGGVVKLLVMFAPWLLLIVFIIVSIIVAPKGEVVKDDEYGLTGFDTAFPNDIDVYDKQKKE